MVYKNPFEETGNLPTGMYTPGWKSSFPTSTRKERGIERIQDYVAANPPETRNQGFTPLDIGTEIRDEYMTQRGSGLPWINEGMNISDFLKSEAASNIASQYGNVLDPGQAYEEWIRSQTAPGTVDTRNQYQLGMSQLRDIYPEAYAEEYPLSDAMMKGLPAIAKLALGKVTGGASSILSAMGDSELGRQSTAMMQSFNPLSDEDEDPRWWEFWKKANGGLASLNGGGSWYGNPHMDPPPSYTPSTPSNTPSYNPNPHLDDGVPWEMGEPTSNVITTTPWEAAAGVPDYSYDPNEESTQSIGPAGMTMNEVLNAPEEIKNAILGIQPEIDDIPPPEGAGGPPPSLVSQPTHIGGTSFTGLPLFGEDSGFEPPPGESPFKEQKQRQFDTQFMAAQYLYDKSRGKFDEGGLANMSENALGEFDTARSTWKWKYDAAVNKLMDGGFTLKEAIDQLWNQGWGMPYKGFSLKGRT